MSINVNPYKVEFSEESTNWILATIAIKYLREGLVPFVDYILRQQHAKLIGHCGKIKCNCSVLNLQPDHAVGGGSIDSCEFGQKDCLCLQEQTDRRTCPNNACGKIYDTILERYFFEPPTPCWKNTSFPKWCTDAWEYGKCFISFPGYEKIVGPEDIDCTGVLHLLVNNRDFHQYLRSRINGKDVFCRVRGYIEATYRNPLHEIDQDTLNKCLQDMIALLQCVRPLTHRDELAVAAQKIAELRIVDIEVWYRSEEFNDEWTYAEEESDFEAEDQFDELADYSRPFESKYDVEFNHLVKIGSGAYGVVFKAEKKIEQHTYAVKRITLPKRKDSEKKVIREVKALAQLEHPNIVRYFSSWIDNPPEGWQEERDERNEISLTTHSSSGSPSGTSSQATGHSSSVTTPRSYLYIQMQLCKTQTLRNWLEDTASRNRKTVLSWFKQITEAIRYLHGKDLVHRDLNPANIFFSEEDIIKVGDFGLAAALSDSEEVLFYSDVGTSFYRSPEIIETKGKVKSGKVDIYSMGVILFELLCYFKTQTERIIVLRKLPLHEYPDYFLRDNPTESHLISRLMATQQDERPSAAEILTEHLPSIQA